MLSFAGETIGDEVQIYSSGGIKGDGNFGLAARIVERYIDEQGRSRLRWPYFVVYGWCGIDGALLKPIVALIAEN